MAVRIGDTLGRIGDMGDYPLVKSEDASYSNADKTSVDNVKDALDELYDVNKKEHLKEFIQNGFLLLNSVAQLNDVNGIKIENNEIAKYIGFVPSGEDVYDENGKIVDDTIEWENGKDFNPDKITLHRGEEYRINYYYINDTQRIIIRPADNNNIVSVQSDWNETDVNSLAYIKNKPTMQASNDGEKHIRIIDNNNIILSNFSDGEYAYSIDLPIDTIFFYNGDKNFIYTSGGAISIILFNGCFYRTKQLDDRDENNKRIMSAIPINVEYQTYGYNKFYKKTISTNEIDIDDYYMYDTLKITYNGTETEVNLKINYPYYSNGYWGKNIKLFFSNYLNEKITLKLINDDDKVYKVGDISTFDIWAKGFMFFDIYIYDDYILVKPENNIFIV